MKIGQRRKIIDKVFFVPEIRWKTIPTFFILLFTLLLSTIGPGLNEAGAYQLVSYEFQNNAALSIICTDVSSANQTAGLFIPGSFSPKYVPAGTSYHFNLSGGAGQPASSLADDMYMQPFGVLNNLDTIRAFIGSTWEFGLPNSGCSGLSIYAKFFDIDTTSACPPFEGGTLIATTPVNYFANPYDYVLLVSSGLNYNILPGHAIRMELWVSSNTASACYITRGEIQLDGVSSATTTVGTGTMPPDITVAPGGPATDLDAFTLQTSAGSELISGVEVMITGASGEISITSDDSSVIYGSGGNSSLIPIRLSTPITATTTPVQYKIRITPVSHSEMPPPPGESYTAQGRVTGLYSLNDKNYLDTTSTTVTIDNMSPGNPVWDVIATNDSHSEVTLNWNNPTDADFSDVIILRNTSEIADVPAEGVPYLQGDIVGSSAVIYAGPLQTFTETGLSNVTPYFYKIFARDTSGNYSTGSSVIQTTNNVTTVGPGISLSNSVIAPGESADLDAFTLQTSGGRDEVGNISVTLSPAGSYAYIGSVAITGDDGTTTYGSVSEPSSDTVVISLSTLIDAVTSPTQYKVRITAKSQAAMPAPPGGLYAVEGIVSGLSSLNVKDYQDTAVSTVTVDNLSPGNPVWGAIAAGDGQVSLNWNNPSDSDFAEVIILRGTSLISDMPSEGMTYVQGNSIGLSTVRYVGNLQSFLDSGISNLTNYYYKIFAKDTSGNYSPGLPAGPYMPMSQITVGEGVNPPDAVIPPGNPPFPVDSFTLQSSSGTNEVTGVTISFAPGSAASMTYVELINDDGGVVYGAAYPADTVTIPALRRIPVTTTPVQYKIRVTPKGRAPIMPWPWSPTGQTYDLSFTIQAITTATPANVTYNDSSSARVILDNLAPLNPSWGAVAPGDKQIALSWTNPADTDFAQVLIVNQCVSPAQGATYVRGDTIGSGTVKYVGDSESFVDTGLTNGSNYVYAIFAKDATGNYSNGSCIGPFVPRPVITLGDGVNPGNLSLAPGGPPSFLDSFTLSMSSGSNSVSALTVTLAPGAAEALSSIAVTSGDGGTTYGSISNPATDTLSMALTPSISVTTSLAQYGLRVTPKSHAAMPVPPGSSYNVTGVVTSLTTTASSIKTYNDSSSAVISIDNASPGNPAWGSIEPGERQIILSWTNPGDQDFNGVIVLRNTSSITDTPVEGVTYVRGDEIGTSKVIFAGKQQGFTDTGLSSSTVYYYKIFSVDTNGNYSTGAASSPAQPLAINSITPGSATASPGLLRIKVYTPFFNDDNRNSSCRIDYKESSAGAWSLWREFPCESCRTGSDTYTCTITWLSGTAYYDVRVTYQDPDGVIGNPEQVIISVKPQSEKVIHNSRTVNSRHWASEGGWGITGGVYGEFTCNTCHAKDSSNISMIRDFILPDDPTANPMYPFGPPRPVRFTMKSPGIGSPEFGLGDDSEPRSMPMVSRICEVCHTLTSGTQTTPADPNHPVGPVHQYNQPVSANHFNANGTDNCTKCCHTHETGFAAPARLGGPCIESYPPPVPDPPAAPVVIPHGNYDSGCSSTAITVTWNPVSSTDGGPVDYNVTNSIGGDSGWISGTSWQFTKPPAGGVTWQVRARDRNHTDAVSGWSVADTFYDQACCDPVWCEFVNPDSNGIKVSMARR